MMTQFINEIKCECEKIVPKDESFECDICRHCYCPGCGTEDYKNTGWFVCNNCLSEPELIIDALIEELQGPNQKFKLEQKKII